MIADLQALRFSWVYRFPTSPRASIRVVRIDSALIGIAPNGRIYATNVRDGRYRLFGRLSAYHQAIVAAGLDRMGLLGPNIALALRAESEAQDRRAAAGSALSDAENMANLGVPLTKRQLDKLRELAGVES